MYDLIIIGGGAAGLSAAMYALGKQLDFLMIYHDIGGKAGTRQHLSGQIEEEYLAGTEAVDLFERRIVVQAGRTLRDGVVEVTKTSGVFHVTTQHHGAHQSTALIVATGATPARLDVPGARELLGYGLGYSATTHVHLLEGKRAAVIGTTVRALRGAAELARTAAHVYLIAPDAAGMTTPLARVLRKRPNIEILAGYQVQQVVGTTSVEELVVAHEEEVRRLPVDAAFVDLGLAPNSMMVRRIVQTDLDGFIWVDDRNATTQPGLFAAGDVTTAFGEQVLIAIGEGARAALSAYDYLLVNSPVPDARSAGSGVSEENAAP
jgi:thioredoxin reductase